MHAAPFSHLYSFPLFVKSLEELGGWNVSSVTNMDGLFAFCYDFESDLSAWDVSKVTNMFGYVYLLVV